MGDRYILEVHCPKCNYHDNDVYYAPTCGFINWECPKCKHKIDLEKYSGISAESCSNKDLINELCGIDFDYLKFDVPKELLENEEDDTSDNQE